MLLQPPYCFHDPLPEHLGEDLSSALREIFLKYQGGCLTRCQHHASRTFFLPRSLVSAGTHRSNLQLWEEQFAGSRHSMVLTALLLGLRVGLGRLGHGS